MINDILQFLALHCNWTNPGLRVGILSQWVSPLFGFWVSGLTCRAISSGCWVSGWMGSCCCWVVSPHCWVVSPCCLVVSPKSTCFRQVDQLWSASAVFFFQSYHNFAFGQHVVLQLGLSPLSPNKCVYPVIL